MRMKEVEKDSHARWKRGEGRKCSSSAVETAPASTHAEKSRKKSTQASPYALSMTGTSPKPSRNWPHTEGADTRACESDTAGEAGTGTAHVVDRKDQAHHLWWGHDAVTVTVSFVRRVGLGLGG